MKRKNQLAIIALVCSMFVVGIWSVSSYYSRSSVTDYSRTETSFSSLSQSSASVSTVDVSRLIEYYEGKLDPTIPKITATAEFNGENYELPYDAVFIEGELAESAQNRERFMNLMNNYWLLPALSDGRIDRTLGETTRFTLHFEQPPDDEVIIIDRIMMLPMTDLQTGIPEYSFGLAVLLSVTSSSDPTGMTYVGNHTYAFTPENDILSFDLWSYYALGYMSTYPHARGMQIRVRYGEKQVEYALLFRTTYNSFLPAPKYTAHLSPLEE
ncbi:MAG: hypothetical protein KH847_02095 [Clostridiales bacterium]|nr:hypothetical protein [Clostridiales bacterium]